jgi:hypothetical protein
VDVQDLIGKGKLAATYKVTHPLVEELTDALETVELRREAAFRVIEMKDRRIAGLEQEIERISKLAVQALRQSEESLKQSEENLNAARAILDTFKRVGNGQV